MLGVADGVGVLVLTSGMAGGGIVEEDGVQVLIVIGPITMMTVPRLVMEMTPPSIRMGGPMPGFGRVLRTTA